MNFYLNKYGFQNPVIKTIPEENLGIAVVIPCFDEPDLIPSLESLRNCMLPPVSVEVIVVVNSGEHHSEVAKKQNRTVYDQACLWAAKNNCKALTYHFILEENLPKKHAGVGLARKIGMDEAVARFHRVEQDGIIVCFDADSLCEPNYLEEIYNHFQKYPKTPGCAIHYEHPLNGSAFSEEIYNGIAQYELHLRYYNQGLRYAGLPYAFHTVGSSMAVRSSAYQKQGGMNKRKAGEDFYFLHKIIELGNFTELKSTTIVPSPRVSDRVPFGTGKAIGDFVNQVAAVYETYAFESFELLKAFVLQVEKLKDQELNYNSLQVPDNHINHLNAFLDQNQFPKVLNEIRSNSKTTAAFVKRFFRWFDAFKVLKFMHFLRDHGLSNGPVQGETTKLLNAAQSSQVADNVVDQLLFLRQLEKK